MSMRVCPVRTGSDAERAASILYVAGAAHVWAFGSLAREHAVDAASDLDLAVDGMGANNLTRAAERNASHCQV
jgi:predicted nucleotidyltransferase